MHLFYVDESGSADMANTAERYFVLQAVGVHEQDWLRLNMEMERLKELVFGCPVELKSTWVRIPKHRQAKYLQPYAMSERDLDQGMEVFRHLMAAPELVYCAVVVDKRLALQDQVSNYRIRPGWSVGEIHRVAYMTLHASINGFLRRQGADARGLMIHDMVQDHQKTGSGYQASLQKGHRQSNRVDGDAFLLMINRRTPQDAELTRIIGDMHFEDSQQSHFLQLADLAAYNVLRQFRETGDAWDQAADVGDMALYPFFADLLPRFMSGPGGRVKGFGLRRILEITTEETDIPQSECRGAPAGSEIDSLLEVYMEAFHDGDRDEVYIDLGEGGWQVHE